MKTEVSTLFSVTGLKCLGPALYLNVCFQSHSQFLIYNIQIGHHFVSILLLCLNWWEQITHIELGFEICDLLLFLFGFFVFIFFSLYISIYTVTQMTFFGESLSFSILLNLPASDFCCGGLYQKFISKTVFSVLLLSHCHLTKEILFSSAHLKSCYCLVLFLFILLILYYYLSSGSRLYIIFAIHVVELLVEQE